MAPLELARIDWSSALEAARMRRPRGVRYAYLASLAGRFSSDFAPAARSVYEACKAEPFNPLHELRMALLLARFGDFQGASVVLDRMREKLPNTALVEYLRALLVLRAGVLDKARAMANAVETAHHAMVQAKFLRAEVQIVSAKASTVEKYLIALPAGGEWEPLWADLLVKLVLLHPADGPVLAQRHIEKKLPKDSPARALVERAISWVKANLEELLSLIGLQPSGSRSEELLIECLVDKLTLGGSEAALQQLVHFGCGNSERPGLRRVYDAFLTRRAAELSGGGKNEAALRLVEQSVRRQPYDLVYHQNRAALFTLLRERSAYQESWAALNTRQYRLALLGASDRFSITQIIKTHRLFAQHAHSSEKNAWGSVFRYVAGEDGSKPRLVVYQEEINAEPELLRLWIYHKQAVLVFQHVNLTGDGRRVFLNPTGRDEAFERASSLAQLAESLRVLVPEEGADLCTILTRRWQHFASEVPSRYNVPRDRTGTPDASAEDGADEEAQAGGAIKSEDMLLHEDHVHTVAELCLLCLQWMPTPTQLQLAEELLRFTDAEIAFFDDRLLRRIAAFSGYETPYPVTVLLSQARSVAGSDKGSLTPEQRRLTVEKCMGELLRGMAISAHNGHPGNAKESAARALVYLDRARALSPSDPRIELSTARFLTIGEFYDDARVALEHYRKIAEPDDDQGREDASKIAEILQERRKEGKASERRSRNDIANQDELGRESRIATLQQELDRSSGLWRLYEELVKELAAAGRFDEAVQWADRSVANCLGRAEQMNARGLAIFARGAQRLSAENPQAARLLAVGAHEPARKALEAMQQQRPLDYIELYALGQCDLAVGLPDEAQGNFQKALELCTRPLHRTVLRGLAANIDSAYISVARAGVNQALSDGRTAEALAEAAAVFGRLKNPAAWVLDFARVYLSVAVECVGRAPLPKPDVRFRGPLQPRLQAALAPESDADRAFALAVLTAEVHPASARQAQVLVERVKVLQRRIAATEALHQAGALLGRKQFGEVLQFLDTRDETLGGEPRLQRLRALALLGLRRFDEADEVVEQISGAGGTEMQEFVAQYPALVFRQRLAAALELLRANKSSAAAPILEAAVAVDEKGASELAYCRAFLAALQGFELRRNGNHEAARERFLVGMNWLAPQLQPGLPGERTHVSELYDRMEKEVDSYVRR